ncbi:augmin complex subunit dgt5 [Uranotaenia lowii]|uniref:augmin complex subunit dgt5 n=1 Tax=Uranotaenia lowii TaxID=190385 RepID=UPI002479DCBE|nr:augmin complex subunit dgt5 [Uranotaenia lowii]
MSLVDEIAQFKLWATGLGCPLAIIPTDETLKKCIRGKQSILFQHIMKQIKPRQEIASMRNNVLVAKLQQYRALGSVVAKSKLNQMPPEIQRYEKVEKLKAKCAETKARIANSKSMLKNLSGKINEKNIQKVKLEQKLESSSDKFAYYKALNNSLAKQSEKEVEIKQNIDQLMPVVMTDCGKTKSEAVVAVQTCLDFLNEFYSKFTELKQEGSKQAQQKLWSNIRKTLAGFPNYLLWCVLMEMKEKQLQEISEADRKQDEMERNVALSDQDMLQVNMAKLCGSHINLFVDLIATKHMVQNIKDDYLAKYTPFSQMLETKMNLLNVMDEEAEQIFEDYMLQSTSKDYNQGQLEFISKEIEKKKQEIKIQNQKLENHEQLLAQLRDIYGETDSYSSRMQEEIMQLKQIKEKISYFKRFSRYTVHNMRQKMTNQTLNLSEQSMNLTRMENVLLTNAPAYNPPTLPPYKSELNLLSEVPFSKFAKSSKIALFSFQTHICLSQAAESNSLLILLPNCFTSAELSLQELRNLIKFDEHLKTFMIDQKPELDVVNQNERHYQQLWQVNHQKISELLDEIEAISGSTKQTIAKSRIYYNFVLANALRKYVPPNKLFNGRNYREYENEYLMYYRMINGSLGGN